MVRIIAGHSKGFLLKVPGKTNRVRPTADRVKEAIFSVIGDRVVNARILDLFCGVGNLGLEALSRGAQNCWFIEQNAVCVRFLKENLTRLKYMEQACVIRGECGRAVQSAIPAAMRFDIVFADPPYNETDRWFTESRNGINLLKVLCQYDTFSSPALFVLEHASKYKIPEDLVQGFSSKTKRYGSTSVTFLEYNP